MLKPSRSKMILCAIAKNEAPYLLEWVVYHRYVIGFDTVLIYQNDSLDQTRDVLQFMFKCGLCEWINWPSKKHWNPQYQAYNHAMNRFRKEDWVAYLDLDEFMVLKRHDTIRECIASLPSADSISFNWLSFGSSGLEKYSDELVMSRFFRCSNQNELVNRHLKSVAKIGCISEPGLHVSLLKSGSKHFHIDGSELYYPDRPQKIHLEDKFAHLNHDVAQVNHYITKSRQEFKNRQMRGRAGVSVHHPNFHIKDDRSYIDKDDVLSPFSHERFNSKENFHIQKHVDLVSSIISGLDVPDFEYLSFIKKGEERYDTWSRTQQNRN